MAGLELLSSSLEFDVWLSAVVLIDNTSMSHCAFCCFNMVFILMLISWFVSIFFFFSLSVLLESGIIVTTSEGCLPQLVAIKDHPKFKEIQNLIKASAPESVCFPKYKTCGGDWYATHCQMTGLCLYKLLSLVELKC